MHQMSLSRHNQSIPGAAKTRFAGLLSGLILLAAGCGPRSSPADTDATGASGKNSAFSCRLPQVGDKMEFRLEGQLTYTPEEPGEPIETKKSVLGSRQEVLAVEKGAVMKLKIFVKELKDSNSVGEKLEEYPSALVGQTFLVAWLGTYTEVQDLTGTRLEGDEGQREWDGVEAMATFRQDFGKPNQFHSTLHGYVPRVGPLPEALRKPLDLSLNHFSSVLSEGKIEKTYVVKNILTEPRGKLVVFSIEFKPAPAQGADPVQNRGSVELKFQLEDCAFRELSVQSETFVHGKSQGVSRARLTYKY